ncbi:hypothetical protein BRC94_13310, partial [Halobacteriales archaeon QS_5_70_17]
MEGGAPAVPAAGAGALGAWAVLGGTASAQAAGTGWTGGTARGNGEFTYQYDAPAPIDPKGLPETVQYRALAGGQEGLTADLGLGIDPDGREFVFDQEGGSARLRGVVVFDGRPGIAVRSDQLPGSTYTFTAAPRSGGPAALTLRTDDRGRISGG